MWRNDPTITANKSAHSHCPRYSRRLYDRARSWITRDYGTRAMIRGGIALLMILSLLIIGACAATGGFPAAAKEALCAVHNSAEMKTLCETPGGK